MRQGITAALTALTMLLSGSALAADITLGSCPRCQDSCRLIGFIKTINRGRKEPCNAALFT